MESEAGVCGGEGTPHLPPISSPHFLDGQTDGPGSPGFRGVLRPFSLPAPLGMTPWLWRGLIPRHRARRGPLSRAGPLTHLELRLACSMPSAKSCENSCWGPPKGPGRLLSQASLKGERGQGGQRLPPSHGDGCGLKEVRLCRQRSRNKTPFLWAEALGATPAWLPGFQWDVWSK